MCTLVEAPIWLRPYLSRIYLHLLFAKTDTHAPNNSSCGWQVVPHLCPCIYNSTYKTYCTRKYTSECYSSDWRVLVWEEEDLSSDPCSQVLLCISSDIAIEEKQPPTKIINSSGSRILTQEISVLT